MNVVDDIIRDFRDLIRADADIEAWCQTNYSVSFQTVVGVDMRNLPPIDIPTVALIPVNKETGLNRAEERPHSVGIDYGINDENIIVNGNDAEMQGMIRLEEFKVLLLATIRKTTSGLIFREILTEYDPVEFFPIFTGGMQLTLGDASEKRPYDYE